MSHHKVFIRQSKENFFHTGSVWPSSKVLAQDMVSYLALKRGRVHVLEAGAGTGAFTQAIVPLLQPGDSLDIVEINPELLFYLKRRFQQEPHFQTCGVDIRLVNADLRHFPFTTHYDYIIFSLPLTNFPSTMVQEILDTMMRHLKPGGVFSYIKYIFIDRLKYLFSGPATKAQMRVNQNIINTFANKYLMECQAVFPNVPPTWVYHWQKPTHS